MHQALEALARRLVTDAEIGASDETRPRFPHRRYDPEIAYCTGFQHVHVAEHGENGWNSKPVTRFASRLVDDMRGEGAEIFG
jgi:hypothetical protein